MPARTETSGQRRSEPTVKNVLMTRRRRRRSRPKGFVTGHRQITIDRVLCARDKMMKNKAKEPADCLVTVMLQCLSTETVYGMMSGSRSVENSPSCFLKKPDAKLEKDFAVSAQSPF